MDRSIPGNELKYEIDELVDKKQLGKIVDFCFGKLGASRTSAVLDKIKAQGFHYSTGGCGDGQRIGYHHPQGKEGVY